MCMISIARILEKYNKYFSRVLSWWCVQDFKESYLLTYFFLHATSLLFDLNWVVTTYSGSFMVRRYIII